MTTAVEVSATVIGNVIAAVLADKEVRTATKIIDRNTVVRATAYGRFDHRERTRDLRVTIGRPNYATRHFIKLCEQAEEPFPVRKIQLKGWPPKKAKAKKKK